ncbi:MAG TPA: DUF2163 domain-containing protein [Burkholderiaceae bacterium]|jgi:uncharacterized phage protein (TIGR02218 family)|nr:DUF2163 domain-containing protein [Burkholderiaceae bacterium]
MKSASPALIALLNSQTFLMADLLTINLVSGGSLYYCNWEHDLVVNGHTYLSGDVQFERTKSSCKIGVNVDSMTITLHAQPQNLMLGLPVMSQIKNGLLDSAQIKIDRVFMSAPGVTTAGTVSIFSGRLTTATAGRSEATLTVANELVLLNVQLPRNIYQPSCLHTLFDDDMLQQGQAPSGCKLIKANFASASDVIAASSATVFTAVISNSSLSVPWFDNGYVSFSGGANSGYVRTIKSATNVGSVWTFTLTSPLPFVPNGGDPFAAYPGCDHTQATCTKKFNNVVNFRGFPYVPVPETAA